jgi:hypothetical protein
VLSNYHERECRFQLRAIYITADGFSDILDSDVGTQAFWASSGSTGSRERWLKRSEDMGSKALFQLRCCAANVRLQMDDVLSEISERLCLHRIDRFLVGGWFECLLGTHQDSCIEKPIGESRKTTHDHVNMETTARYELPQYSPKVRNCRISKGDS